MKKLLYYGFKQAKHDWGWMIEQLKTQHSFSKKSLEDWIELYHTVPWKELDISNIQFNRIFLLLFFFAFLFLNLHSAKGGCVGHMKRENILAIEWGLSKLPLKNEQQKTWQVNHFCCFSISTTTYKAIRLPEKAVFHFILTLFYV